MDKVTFKKNPFSKIPFEGNPKKEAWEILKYNKGKVKAETFRAHLKIVEIANGKEEVKKILKELKRLGVKEFFLSKNSFKIDSKILENLLYRRRISSWRI